MNITKKEMLDQLSEAWGFRHDGKRYFADLYDAIRAVIESTPETHGISQTNTPTPSPYEYDFTAPPDSGPRVTMADTIICPFCGDDGFDLVGLRGHLEQWCLVYQDITYPFSPFAHSPSRIMPTVTRAELNQVLCNASCRGFVGGEETCRGYVAEWLRSLGVKVEE